MRTAFSCHGNNATKIGPAQYSALLQSGSEDVRLLTCWAQYLSYPIAFFADALESVICANSWGENIFGKYGVEGELLEFC